MTLFLLAQATGFAINWTGVATLVFALLIQLIGLIIALAKMHSKIATIDAAVTESKDTIKSIQSKELISIAERTAKLEWQALQQDKAVTEMRESLHKINDQLQTLIMATTRVADSVEALKQKAEK